MFNDIKGFIGLSSDVNKQKGDVTEETQEGIVSDKLPELKLRMSNEEIIKLTQKWEAIWKSSPKKTKWLEQIKENEDYWLGKQFSDRDVIQERAEVDNLIFESLETYLPQTTRRNPEPLVELHHSEIEDEPDPAKEEYIEKVKNKLKDIADEGKLRLKLKKTARHWAIYQLGVAKFGWDLDKDMPRMQIVRAKRLILDPDALIDEDGYTGNRVGEYRKLTASFLLDVIKNEEGNEEAVRKINEVIKGDKATEIQFIEWWTQEFMVWTLGDVVLLKKKNPHWNYDTTEEDTSVDSFGNETKVEKDIEAINHFAVPKIPYIFLTVFNLGDQPMDKTGLIQQNLANQDLINKRIRQIDKNADKMNGGAVISQERSGLSQAQAKNVVKAVRKGGAIIIPSGAPQDAVYFPQVPSLPADIYNQLLDTRSRMRDIFGTSGSTPAGVKQENTVRGKILSRGLDTDRVGGGVSEYLEQFADDAYNWFVQLLYVYDDAFQFIEGAKPPKIIISVKEGSLLPKDSVSIASQALQLAGMGKISNIDLYKRLDYPNPEELAANVWLETNAPQILYKNNQQVQEALGIIQQNQQQDQEIKQQEAQQSHQRDLEKEQFKQSGDNLVPQVPQNEVQ